MNLAEEKIIVEQAKTDPEAFGKIFDWYGPRILNYTLKFFKNKNSLFSKTAFDWTRAVIPCNSSTSVGWKRWGRAIV